MEPGSGTITRPNGKPYRPRSNALQTVEYEDADARREEDEYGVIVFGTLDPEEARPAAEQRAVHGPLGSDAKVLDGRPGWLRDGYQGGHRMWITDEAHGRPCVTFPVVER